MTIKRLALPLVSLLASSVLVWAGCISDCKDEYDSAVESCKLMHDEPEDADELQQCIQNAKDEYQSCVEECTS
jgi:hypothetical protein